MIDEQGPFELRAAAGERLPDVTFISDQLQWAPLDYDDSITFSENPDTHKRQNLQGPIDDAFMQPFICVRGTGTPWSPAHQAWADWTLDRFAGEFDKWMRGTLPIVDDTDLTAEDVAGRNLILFGDPGSNSVLARVLEGLPLDWTTDGIALGGNTYDPDTHGVAMIYPNPLQPERYVVINSGHTMHSKDFKASNAWLFPKLGDIALLRFSSENEAGFSETTIWADLFDAHWNLPPREGDAH